MDKFAARGAGLSHWRMAMPSPAMESDAVRTVTHFSFVGPIHLNLLNLGLYGKVRNGASLVTASLSMLADYSWPSRGPTQGAPTLP
jgi:hypothetical protein